MRIGLDLDGVCYDFFKAYKGFLLNVGRITQEQHDAPHNGEWNFHNAWGIDSAEFMQLFEDGVNKQIIFLDGEAYPDTRENVQRILDLGHDIHVITDRTVGLPGVSFGLTGRWIEWQLPKPIKSITFTRDKTVVPTDMMIDDKPSNVRELLAAGCDAYLLNQPWNQEATDLSRHRVGSLTEFVNRVELRTLITA
jgi:hypothetical protein